MDETNLRQRVLGNTNPVKLGRCFSFLNKWYGFKNGGDRKSSEKVFNLISSNEPSTQKELAESYGITKQTMNNYMRMANIIPGGQTVPAFQLINKMDEELRNNFVTPILHFDVELTNNSEAPKTQKQLETNIRQRGDVGGSAKKVGLRIKELERIYGIKVGNPNYEKNSQLKTQTQLATDMGMDVRTLQNYKLLAEMIPELSDLLDTGIISQIPTNILTMYIKSNNINI